MIKVILLVLFYFFFPLVIIFLCKKLTLLQKIGTIGMAYLIGLFLGSIGFIPRGSEEYKLALNNFGNGKNFLTTELCEQLHSDGKITEDDLTVNIIASVQENVLTAVVVLAFPLLLFSINIRRWLNVASRGFFSVILGLIAGITMVTIGFFIWKDSFDQSAKLAGMFVGMYTGGTANFAALQIALGVDKELFVIANTYDIVVGVVLVLFFISIAYKVFGAVLPKYKPKSSDPVLGEIDISKETADPDDFSGLFQRKNIKPLLAAFGLSALIVAVSAGIASIMKNVTDIIPFDAWAIFFITVFGILAALNKRVNRIDKTFQMGMYLILVFSLTIASMSDLERIMKINMMGLVLFISWCYWGSLILHLLLARVFKIDADNFLITSTALIFSPPFVPLVARYIKNKDLIATGITGGLLGLMAGNIIGLILGTVLQRF